jgi:ribosomal protein L24E
MATTMCSCCGKIIESEKTVLLVMPDQTIRRVCLSDINAMWKKRNPTLKARNDRTKK